VRVYRRDRDFGEVEGGRKMMLVISTSWKVRCPISSRSMEGKAKQNYMAPIPEETANPEAEAKAERR
jgi:hypothetical protein